jgi:general secretion pathway protein G
MDKRIIPYPPKQQGFSLLELVVVVCIIAILMAVAYQRFERMSEEAERASFYGALNTFQALINRRVIEWYIDSTQIEKAELEQLNPVEWLERPPHNYGGLISLPQLEGVVAARWYYIKDKHWLVYKVKRTLGLQNKGSDVLAFRLRVSFKEESMKKGVVQAANLEAVTDFDWTVSGQ